MKHRREVLERGQWSLLPQDEYTQKQLDGMVAWFTARKDVLEFVTLEPHRHDGRPAGTPYSMESM